MPSATTTITPGAAVTEAAAAHQEAKAATVDARRRQTAAERHAKALRDDLRNGADVSTGQLVEADADIERTALLAEHARSLEAERAADLRRAEAAALVDTVKRATSNAAEDARHAELEQLRQEVKRSVAKLYEAAVRHDLMVAGVADSAQSIAGEAREAGLRWRANRRDAGPPQGGILAPGPALVAHERDVITVVGADDLLASAIYDAVCTVEATTAGASPKFWANLAGMQHNYRRHLDDAQKRAGAVHPLDSPERG